MPSPALFANAEHPYSRLVHDASEIGGSTKAQPGPTERAFGDRYIIERELGRGATAVVYLAQDRTAARMVAIKILRRELLTSVSTARFLREIEIGRQLEHPNVVPILDSGTLGDDLYFTMPVADGETLRQRLARERHIPVGEACEIAALVARVLAYAHARGIIHRDIKPSNILLSDGKVFVADFGIARAMTIAAGDRLTESGLAIGTPEYMSPEQSVGDQTLDGRSDVYALGCVLYEMLAGEPPFTGPTPQAVIARHCQEAPRSIRVVRPSVPVELERVVEKALAKVPADRIATPAEFAEALANPSLLTAAETRDAIRSLTARRWQVIAAAVVLVAVIATAAVLRGGDSSAFSKTRQRDSTTYALTFDSARVERAAAGDLAAAVRDALHQWRGIVVADASTAGVAGRLIRMEVSPGAAADSIRLRATLVDTRTDSVLDSDGITVARLGRGRDSAMTALVARLLFPGAGDGVGGTSSFAAQQAYLRGRSALMDLNLARADSEFRHATESDSGFSRAFLGLAQARQWLSQPATQWTFAAERAAADTAHVRGDEQVIAAALVDVSHDRRDAACAKWSALTVRDSNDFTAWYGLGNCLRNDNVVVRDVRSPTGWRFRASYQQAVVAYERAFQLSSTANLALSEGVLDDMQFFLNLRGTQLRPGKSAAPDSLTFVGRLSYRGDTLVLLPLPRSGPMALAGLTHNAGSLEEAILLQRNRFQLMARMWRVRLPSNAGAIEAVARALDVLGNASAVDTIALARHLAGQATPSLRIGALEVWLRLKYSAPGNPDGLLIAAALADSLLDKASPRTSSEARVLASLAALRGRASLAARLAREDHTAGLPVSLQQTAPALLEFSALGGPVDSLRRLESAMEMGIASGVPLADRPTLRRRWVVRAASIALPEYEFAVVRETVAPVSRSDTLLAALRTRDKALAARVLAQVHEEQRRQALHSYDITPTTLYGAAALLSALGAGVESAAQLDATLDSLAFMQPQTLTDAGEAGTLIRSFRLRATLAAQLGDTATARKWARVVKTLWSKPDPFLRATTDEMQRLSR